MMEAQKSLRQLERPQSSICQAEHGTKQSYKDYWFGKKISAYVQQTSTFNSPGTGDYRKQDVAPEKDQGME